MSKPTRPNRINIDLGVYKAPWLQYCRERGTTPSAAFRQVVAVFLKDAHKAAAEIAYTGSLRKVRKQITLTVEEASFVEARAHAEGYSSTRWLIALLQARMGNGAQFGQYELEALGRSNLALLAIGRNLNQIARSLNMGGSSLGDIGVSIARIETTINSHTSQVSQVMSRNLERWNSK